MRCYPSNTEATDGELSASFTWFCSRAAPCGGGREREKREEEEEREGGRGREKEERGFIG